MEKQKIGTPSTLLMNGLILYVRLTTHLLRLDCRKFITSVFYSLIAKILLFLSMALPVKIILFLNPSQQVPGFILELLGSKTNLVLALCGVMLASMVLATAFKKKSNVLEGEKTDNLLSLLTEKPDKKVISSTKSLVAKCVLSSALMIFSFICMIGALILYPILLAVSIMSFTSYIMFANFSIKRKRSRLHNTHKANNASEELLSKLGGFTFIASFLYIVFDATINNAEHGFLTLVISLLLVRQYSSMSGKTADSLVKINNSKNYATKILEKKN